MTLVLASASPTRAAILREAGIAFEVLPTAVDERALRAEGRAEGISAGAAALRLAEAKAAWALARRPRAAVLGADQILSLDGEWFEKPRDLVAAGQHLRRLRGRRHVLHTAAVLVGVCQPWRYLVEPALVMRDLTDAEVDAYVAFESGALLNSVGAYRIEGPGAALFASIAGETAAVRGLPLQALCSALLTRGLLTS